MTTEADSIAIRAAEPADFEALVALNNAAIPAVNPLSVADFADFRESAALFRVVGELASPVALMIALAPGLAYDSLNYRWFEARYDGFLYVDRIIVDPQRRSAGIGAALYRALEYAARAGGFARLACEVNLRPANDRSLRFHQRLGFRAVGTQDTEGGAKSVQLMIRNLP